MRERKEFWMALCSGLLLLFPVHARADIPEAQARQILASAHRIICDLALLWNSNPAIQPQRGIEAQPQTTYPATKVSGDPTAARKTCCPSTARLHGRPHGFHGYSRIESGGPTDSRSFHSTRSFYR